MACLNKDEVNVAQILNRAQVYDRFKVYDHVNRITFYRILRGEESSKEHVKAVRDGVKAAVSRIGESF